MVEAAFAELGGVVLSETEDREATRRKMGIGEPDDVAYMVLFLASDESKHVTGAELVVDNATSGA